MPALQTSWNLQFKITNNIATDYDSGIQLGMIPDFSQSTQQDLVLQTGTVNLALPTPIQNLCVIYVLCDQPVTLSLVPQGSNLAAVQPITLYPNIPGILPLQFIQEVYVTNQTGQIANFSFMAAGK